MSPSWFKAASLIGLAIGATAQTSTGTVQSYTWTTTTKTKTTSQCSVVWGATAPAAIVSVFNTISQHYPVTRQAVTTPTVTSTPAAVTAFANTTKLYTTYTTIFTSTDVVKETSLSVETINKAASTTVTTTSTFNRTIAVAPATATVQPSAGFIPLASAIAAKQTRLAKRGFEAVSPNYKQKVLADGSFHPPRFPSQVVCNTLIQYIEVRIRVAIAQPITVVAIPSTTTSTTTVSASITSTIVSVTAPTTSTDVFTSMKTVYASATSTVTQVVTNTVTSTDTSLPTPTYYAACNSSNVVSSVTISGKVEGVSDVYLAQAPGRLNAKNAYECCVACINSANCAFSQFFTVLSGSNCFLARKANRDNADPKEIAGQFYVSAKVASGASFLSNSNKGQVEFLGEQPDSTTTTTTLATTTKTGTTTRAGAATNHPTTRPYGDFTTRNRAATTAAANAGTATTTATTSAGTTTSSTTAAAVVMPTPKHRGPHGQKGGYYGNGKKFGKNKTVVKQKNVKGGKKGHKKHGSNKKATPHH